MAFSRLRRRGTVNQYLISLLLITMTTVTCYLSVDIMGYRIVALVLLLVVSILAMLFDILPVLITAVMSALIWNFFFIPPTYNFYIGNTEDVLMFMMYFVIAMINAVLTFKIRQFEGKARDKDEREKTIRLYNTLLNSLSHELRTPVATIIGSVDTIRDNGNKISAHSINELHDEIAAAGFRLNRQVENLLNMSRLEAGVLQPKLDWCDVNELVYSVIRNNWEDILNHTITFDDNESLPLFKIDRGLMEQVLNNIVYNAIQHTPPQTEIKIEITWEDGMCRFMVTDKGSGFPEKEIQSAFEKFYRISKSSTGGTGLGLSIAKGFTEAQRGNIYLENVKNGGAKFTIELPAEAAVIDQLEK